MKENKNIAFITLSSISYVPSPFSNPHSIIARPKKGRKNSDYLLNAWPGGIPSMFEVEITQNNKQVLYFGQELYRIVLAICDRFPRYWTTYNLKRNQRYLSLFVKRRPIKQVTPLDAYCEDPSRTGRGVSLCEREMKREGEQWGRFYDRQWNSVAFWVELDLKERHTDHFYQSGSFSHGAQEYWKFSCSWWMVRS